MKALTILKDATNSGVSISLNGDRLALRSNVKPPEILIARIRAQKAEIVDLLRKEAALEVFDGGPEAEHLATVATIATDQGESSQSVAGVASVAREGNAPDAAPEPDEAEIEYRAGLAADGVPAVFLDAWARLQCCRPIGIPDEKWRMAVNDAGLFLDRWGSLAVDLGWASSDLFDVPRNDKHGGLAWFLCGEALRELGPEHAVTKSGRVFDRLELRGAAND